MSNEPPTVITDDVIEPNEPALIAGLKYILTADDTEYEFIVKSLNDQDEIVEERHIKSGDNLEEAELNLLVGAVLNEFQEKGIQPSTDHDELRTATAKIIKDLTEKNKPE